MYIKSLLRKIVLGMQTFRRPSVRYCSTHGLLPGVLVQTPSKVVRDLFFLPESPYSTQLNQDIFALLINRFESGYFLEIGANDGFTLSNTIYLEEHFGWKGLLIEANPQYSSSLERRAANSVIAAIVDKAGSYEFCNAGLYGGIKDRLDSQHEARFKDANVINVRGARLEPILTENHAPELINFVSIDVEGAEVEIVKQLCGLRSHKFLCGCVEHNGREDDYRKIKQLLEESGYLIVWERQTSHDLFFIHEG